MSEELRTVSFPASDSVNARRRSVRHALVPTNGRWCQALYEANDALNSPEVLATAKAQR